MRAHQALQDALRAATVGAHGRLPTIASLAATAKVSRVTMWKCVRALVDSGAVTARPNQGIRVAKIGTDVRPARAAILRTVNDVAGAIRRACASMEFPPAAQLPPAKAIADRYGVSPPTVYRALSGLISDGTIVRTGRRYSVRRVVARTGGAGCIVLVASGDQDGRMAMVTQRTVSHVSSAERACFSHGMILRVVTNTQITMALDARTPKRLAQLLPREITGLAVWPMGFTGDAQVALVLEQLMRFGSPVAVLEENRDDSALRRSPPAGVKVFALDVDERAGYVAGCYLRRLGHRRVAFVHHGDQDSRLAMRGAGVARALRESFGDEARLVTSNTGYVSSVADDARHVTELATIMRRHAGAQLRRRLDLRHVEEEWLGARLWPLITEVEERHRMRHVLDSDLMNARVSAVVGANDATAISALAWLRAHGHPVPDEVSVLGFDNGIEAAAQQLTSYDFGGNEAAAAMIDYLSSPSHAPCRRRPTSEVTVIGGSVIARRSTAVAPAPRSPVR